MVGDAGDGLADGASYCLGAGRELERDLAVGAVYQHQHRGNLLKFQGKMEGFWDLREREDRLYNRTLRMKKERRCFQKGKRQKGKGNAGEGSLGMGWGRFG